MIQVERMVRDLCEMVQISSELSEEQEFIKYLGGDCYFRHENRSSGFTIHF